MPGRRVGRRGVWPCAALAALLAGCPPAEREERVAADPQPLEVQQLQQTPCDSELRVTEAAAELLTGGSTAPNEAHDCQRLVENGEFGPLVGVYPVDRAMQIGNVADFDSAVAVASIYNWDAAAYAPLGLLQGLQCLVLERDPNSGRWRGELYVPNQRCNEPVETMTKSADLTAHRFQLESSGPYPQTARFEWDPSGGRHYIGVRCADGWCTAGGSGYTPAEHAPLSGPPGRDVPGWYDAQHLAVPDGAGGLRPGPWAVIYPAADLGTATTADFDTFREAAVVELDASPTADVYFEKLNLRPGENLIELRNFEVSPGDGNWAAEVTPTNPLTGQPAPRMLEVERVGGVLHAAAGAVRWRWLADDESGWVYCDVGCCTVRGFLH